MSSVCVSNLPVFPPNHVALLGKFQKSEKARALLRKLIKATETAEILLRDWSDSLIDLKQA